MITVNVQVKNGKKIIGNTMNSGIMNEALRKSIEQFNDLPNHFVTLIIQNSISASISHSDAKSQTNGLISFRKKGHNHSVIYVFMLNVHKSSGNMYLYHAAHVIGHELGHLHDYLSGTFQGKTGKEKEIYADSFSDRVTGIQGFHSALEFYQG